MLFKGLRSVVDISFDRHVCLYAFLLPIKRDAATDLNEGIDDVSVGEEKLSLHKVSNVAIVVDAS